MHAPKRVELTKHGGVDKTAVAGAKDQETNQVRAQVVAATDSPILHGFVFEHAAAGPRSTPMKPASTVASAALFYHYLSYKHLQRYVNELAVRKGMHELDTIDQMGTIAVRMVGRRLMYLDLIR